MAANNESTNSGWWACKLMRRAATPARFTELRLIAKARRRASDRGRAQREIELTRWISKDRERVQAGEGTTTIQRHAHGTWHTAANSHT